MSQSFVHRPRALVLAGLALIPLLLAACGSSSTAPGAAATAKLALDWTPNTNHTGDLRRAAEGLVPRRGRRPQPHAVLQQRLAGAARRHRTGRLRHQLHRGRDLGARGGAADRLHRRRHPEQHRRARDAQKLRAGYRRQAGGQTLRRLRRALRAAPDLTGDRLRRRTEHVIQKRHDRPGPHRRAQERPVRLRLDLSWAGKASRRNGRAWTSTRS